MKINIVRQILLAVFLLSGLWLSSCRSSNTASGNTEENRGLSPERVDIRGSIVTSRYSEGQVVLEVEGFGTTPSSRYNRAFVLVMPTTQIVGPDGDAISLSELRQGQFVSILLRGGGQGDFVGVGLARKMWVENRF